MRMVNVIFVSLFFIFSFVCIEAQIPSFSWADCGVPGSRNIHYQSVTVSPYPAETDFTNATLSINVEATTVLTIYDGDTYVSIWQDGEPFMQVQVMDLCDILDTQNGLSCPIPAGKISFTYTFTNLPEMPQGDYMVKISSSLPQTGEFGCLQLGGEIEGAYSTTSCMFTSYANAALNAGISPQTRTNGTAITISSTKVTNYETSPDLVTSTPWQGYSLTLSGTVISQTTSGTKTYEEYQGSVSLWYANSPDPIYTGYFNASGVFDSSNPTSGNIVGTITLDPAYQYLPDLFYYPLAMGNLNPYTMQMNAGGSLQISGSKKWCTCAIDDCGVCGGDGSTCALGSSSKKGISAKEKAAIAIGVGGGVLGVVLVAVLARSARKARRAPLLNDQDLIDHPDKPDYGTMAIDEAIREGDRV